MRDTSTGPTEGKHIFSVDLEEYFQVHAFDGIVARDEWDIIPSRVEAPTGRLLDLLERTGNQATFFTLGWVADRHPDLLRRISEAGHEVASHGYGHKRLTEMTPDEFRADLQRSRQSLESATGKPVFGYRAPTFSLVPGTEWAFDILIDEGFAYDSSLFPIRRAGYGFAGAKPEVHEIQRAGGRILEIPMTTTVVAGIRLPAAGGGWFRQLPYGLTRSGFRRCERMGNPGMFYIHPWELDPEQPRIPVPYLQRVRHYRGLRRIESRLERLMSDFSFTSVRERFQLGDQRADREAMA
jgi:polysaccharide deacetylase family protein (PEP-CTERM system associated)